MCCTRLQQKNVAMETPPPPIQNMPKCPAENLTVPKRPNRKSAGRTFTELPSQCRFCSPKKKQYGLQAYSTPITKRSHFWHHIFTQTTGSTGLLDLPELHGNNNQNFFQIAVYCYLCSVICFLTGIKAQLLKPSF